MSETANRSAAPLPPRRPAVLGGEPLFDADVFVTRPVLPTADDFAARIATIFDSHRVTNDGPLMLELEQRLAAWLGVRACTTFCNGTTALMMALRALGLRGEVITTPFTFPATPHCIEWNGLRPVFADIDPETWCLDPAAVASRIGPETAAILPVHVFGHPCDVSAFEALGARHDLRIVYDAAHAFGVVHRDRPLVGYGDCAALSFHATKVFHTTEGGAVVSGDAALVERLALLRNFGIVSEDEVQGVGLNGKLSELHSAMGLLVLERVRDEIARRGRLTALYRAGLSDLPGLRMQAPLRDTTPNHFNLAVEIDPDAFGLTRDEVHRALLSEHVVSRKYFHPLCSENDCYRGLPSAAPEVLPNAHRVASRVLCLPLYGELGEDAVLGVVETLASLHAAAPAVRRALA